MEKGSEVHIIGAAIFERAGTKIRLVLKTWQSSAFFSMFSFTFHINTTRAYQIRLKVKAN